MTQEYRKFQANEYVNDLAFAHAKAVQEQLDAPMIGHLHLFVIQNKDGRVNLAVSNYLPDELAANPEAYAALAEIFKKYTDVIIDRLKEGGKP